ncbi:MAG: hypothetical protein AYK18_17765 [Theionarchaea archaeon DG-70]|nr:MAG: hypothetical protein AYK18_17765 [Theionarchaea archaeon DG-70]
MYLMNKTLKFILIGLVFAGVEEFLTIALIKEDLSGFFIVMVLVFPLYLTIVYFSSKIIDYFWRREIADVIHFFTYGIMGLMIEWFLIGLSPWSNPEAHPGTMLIFQVGMFSFWATLSFVPRIFIDGRKKFNKIKKKMLKFYVSYFTIVYVIAFLLPVYARFVILILLIIVGYSLMNIFYLQYFLKSFSNPSK